jgi:hypothetical protein
LNFKFPLVLLLLLFSLQGFADAKSLSERVRRLEEQKGFFPKTEKVFHGYIGVQLLYWKGGVDGAAYATKSKIVSGDTTTHVETLAPHFQYDPGFRIFVGMESPFDLFDTIVVWTRFTTVGRDSAHATGEKVIFDEIGLINPLDSTPNHAQADCRVKGNVLDLQFGRGISLSRDFFFRPYFGLRGLWSDVDWRIQFNTHFPVPSAFNQESTKLKVDNDFRGIGGVFGIMADWKLPMGFGIMTRGAGGLVYGPTKEATTQELIFLPASSSIPIRAHYKAHNSSHSIKGMWELFGGFYWEVRINRPQKYKSSKHFHLRLMAGYELQQWPYIAQKTNIQDLRQRERYSLGFEGFTGGIRILY